MERFFAPLYNQIQILDIPARLSSLNDLNDIVQCCSILHKMIAKERGYAGTAKFRMSESTTQSTEARYSQVEHPTSTYDQAELWRQSLDRTDSTDDHLVLPQALLDNIWNGYGDDE